MGMRGRLMVLIGFMTAVSLGMTAYLFVTLARLDSDGMVINVAGRQRLLSQRMAKEALMPADAEDPDVVRRDLSATMALFNRSQVGLRSGDPEMERFSINRRFLT